MPDTGILTERNIMPTNYDIFLACAPKDFNKLPYVVQSIVDNLEAFNNIYICSPRDIPVEIQSRIPFAFYFYLDDAVLPEVKRAGWNFRPNWHFQQCLKLFQNVTDDWYLTWDCDTIACRKIPFIIDGKPVYYIGWEQCHAPYFVFQNEMIRLGKVGPTTFIADMNFIYRPIVEEMLQKNGYTIKSFIEKCQRIATKDCYMAEPELYGSYVWQNHRDLYVYRQLQQRAFEGRIHKGEKSYEWNPDEIEDRIAQYGKNYDTFSVHSWFIEKGID
jgi:hypothetical protein